MRWNTSSFPITRWRAASSNRWAARGPTTPSAFSTRRPGNEPAPPATSVVGERRNSLVAGRPCSGDGAMSFELKSDEALRKSLRRIVRKQLEGALDLLTGDVEGPRDDVVHEARKCFKKVRAVLRLV